MTDIFSWCPWLAGCAVLKARGVARGLDKFPVALAWGKHLFPFRTEQLSPTAPMVLGLHGPGRVGRRRFFIHEPPSGRLVVVWARVRGRRPSPAPGGDPRPSGRVHLTAPRRAGEPRRVGRGRTSTALGRAAVVGFSNAARGLWRETGRRWRVGARGDPDWGRLVRSVPTYCRFSPVGWRGARWRFSNGV